MVSINILGLTCACLFNKIFITLPRLTSHLLQLDSCIPTWISNHMLSKIWSEINYPVPNFHGFNVEVWEWISNFIAHFTMDVSTCPCSDPPVNRCWRKEAPEPRNKFLLLILFSHLINAKTISRSFNYNTIDIHFTSITARQSSCLANDRPISFQHPTVKEIIGKWGHMKRS